MRTEGTSRQVFDWGEVGINDKGARGDYLAKSGGFNQNPMGVAAKCIRAWLLMPALR